jgi:hypothetical protein
MQNATTTHLGLRENTPKLLIINEYQCILNVGNKRTYPVSDGVLGDGDE